MHSSSRLTSVWRAQQQLGLTWLCPTALRMCMHCLHGCRYFVLTGTVLRYYRSERDVARSPRGVVDVQVSLGLYGCCAVGFGVSVF